MPVVGHQPTWGLGHHERSNKDDTGEGHLEPQWDLDGVSISLWQWGKMDVRTLQALLLSGKWRLVPYEVHEAGMAGSTTLAGGKSWMDGRRPTHSQ